VAAGPPTFDQLAGTAYGALILEQLAEERATKNSLEQRSALVITAAGGLVTLLLGLGSVVTSSKDFTAPHNARVLLAVALGFFFLAALGGVVANLPWGYAEVDTDELQRLTGQYLWEGGIRTATRRVAESYVDVIRVARSANSKKATAVRAGFACEMAAVGLLGAAVVVILL
jgi:hypothetical protein